MNHFQRMREDIAVVVERDPAVHSSLEALLSPHLVALWLHRISHAAYRAHHRVLARFVFQVGRLLSGGIEIHPGARIGRRLFIDHGCGTVIGETAVIGDDVTLYHQVTLGAVGWWRDRNRPAGARRHPTLGSRVVVGAQAVLLGPLVVGDDARIGAKAFITEDVPPAAVVSAERSTVVPRDRRHRHHGHDGHDGSGGATHEHNGRYPVSLATTDKES